MERRRVLVTAGSLLPISVAGCVSISTDSDDEDGESPEPVVEAVRVPAVAHVDRDGMPPIESIDADANPSPSSNSNPGSASDPDSTSTLELTGTFENDGDPGAATILLYLLEADDDSDAVLTAPAPALGTSVHFDAGERREIVFDDADFDADLDGYDAYYLEAQIGAIEADVRNDGEAGPIDVTLTTPSGGQVRGHIDDQQELELATDETETVTFEGAFSREQESYDVRAEATRAEEPDE